MKLALITLAACLTGCSFLDTPSFTYRMQWVCGQEICARVEDVRLYDRARLDYADLEITSTMDENLFTDGIVALSNEVPRDDCRLVHGLSFFGHDLEPSMFCYTPNGFELTVTIPDDPPETSSRWVIMAREI